MLPRDRFTVGSERGGDRVVRGGAVVTAANVVLAGPDDFDGRLDGFRRLNGFLHEVTVGNSAASETAA